MVEVLWKTMTGILNRRLVAAIHFYNTLQGLRMVIGTSNASLESNLLQQLVYLR